MSISDRDRKILWARAGNRCSICRCELVHRSGESDANALIGEECHIRSPRAAGPRGLAVPDPSRNLGAYDNLILLCPSDHSRIDQLLDEYSEERLRSVKAAHESWVSAALAAHEGRPVILSRAQPRALAELVDADALISVVANAHESSYSHQELVSEAEVDTVAELLQAIHDYAEIWEDLEPGARVRATFELGRMLGDVQRDGWRVFGVRTRGTLGAANGEASPWYTAYLRVVRSNSTEIISGEGVTDPGAPAVDQANGED